MKGIIIDNFAGGGGACTRIEIATDRSFGINMLIGFVLILSSGFPVAERI